ncbi:MAG TPA: lysophospholipid acyltransferase family protein [Thermoanaerobaculia bacterium]|nr:lysophospholipid acyltransferase family protein [Thermoanaerobaculia bacterium]
MIFSDFKRRFGVHGVGWRKLLSWGVHNVPSHLEPFVIATWAAIFMLWREGRKGVSKNLRLIFPGSSEIATFFRAYRVFASHAWSLSDSSRFQERRTIPDWEFVGFDHFQRLIRSKEGAIILTAHMGNYDLGSFLFSEKLKRPLTVVRAPEAEEDTGEFIDTERERTLSSDIKVGYNASSDSLAIELIETLRSGGFVAIQGDLVSPTASAMSSSLFGKKVRLPAGPFALAMASRALIYPLFVVRMGRRSYRIITLPPGSVHRTGRDRAVDLQRAVDAWAVQLETVVRKYWFQWFMFTPVEEESAR